MRRGRGILLLALGAALLGGGLYLAFRPAPIQVEVATVTRGRFVATVEEDGRTPSPRSLRHFGAGRGTPAASKSARRRRRCGR